MSKFKTGDRVVVTQNSSVGDYKDLKGLHGTVVVLRDSCVPYGVTLDDRQHPSNTNGMYYFDDSELDFESHIQPCYYATVDCSLSIKGKENEKMKLLEIYFDEKIKQLEIEHDKKRDKIKTKDPIIKEVYALAKKYKDVKGLSIFPNYEYQFSQEILEEMNKCDREYRVQREKFSSLEYEIKAQLDICETYEQKMNVLKAYGVVDEQGKLIK